MKLWEEILDKKRSTTVENWCIIGDFNCIRRMDERVGDGTIGEKEGKGGLREYSKFIDDMEAEGLPMIGRRYTWYTPNALSRSRIDRVMISKE